MTRPRITLSMNTRNEIELWLNPAGRDLLVRELQALNATNEHLHLGPSDEFHEVPLEARAYGEGDRVFEWGKVLFRLDEWDAEYFPHVMPDGDYPAAGWAESDPAYVFEPGMDNFVVEFGRDGEMFRSVFTFGWDEAGALASARRNLHHFPDADSPDDGGKVEVRVGKSTFETIFGDWMPLDG